MTVTDSMSRFFGGKSVVLTGAASGIGRSTARFLSQAGATVHALDANREGLASLASESPGPGAIHPVTLDVCDSDQYAQVIGDVLERSRTIDFLFNNAGVTQLGEAQSIPFERWKRLLDINLMGVIHGCRLVYPIMIAQGSGYIVNTASLAGVTGYASAAGYAASKAAVIELTRSLRAEAKIYGVRVSAVCPGYVNSGIFAQDHIVGADREAVINDLPVKMMSPDEAATHLLSGVMKGKNMIVFPLSARVLLGLSTWTPSLLAPLQRKLIRVFRVS
jgi:NADP-dependent 3-hydroxy acid dehydrogenase YdfG